MDTNIYSLEKTRELKSLKETEVSFQSYLNVLKQEELQYEANYIIDKINDDDLSNEFLLKSSLLMDELAKRVQASSMANTISKYSKNLRSKLDQRLQ